MIDGFRAVVERLGSGQLHLSASSYSNGYVCHYFPRPGAAETREVNAWFGKDVGKKLLKLKPGQGVHFRLKATPAKLTKKEIEDMCEHDCSQLLTLEDL
jgi:hypothetical protein